MWLSSLSCGVCKFFFICTHSHTYVEGRIARKYLHSSSFRSGNPVGQHQAAMPALPDVNTLYILLHRDFFLLTLTHHALNLVRLKRNVDNARASFELITLRRHGYLIELFVDCFIVPRWTFVKGSGRGMRVWSNTHTHRTYHSSRALVHRTRLYFYGNSIDVSCFDRLLQRRVWLRK